ncbi:ZinT family metal-binding protein [Salipiger abyssi]|uniref:ZinT family metal-binding protein n=1 Tax=Salipiger abyssi TaxID=1250539 RepID=UPI001A8FEFDD|nr:metal-binding protein ZinT [Salipiger abyssi]MBN9889725.1 metal-binding protein ZinT [Salipiger abyssi]
MQKTLTGSLGAIALSSLLCLAGPMQAQADDHAHDHDHAHTHDDSADAAQIYKGYFQDSQIADRPLSDWEGEWQSVYPLLQDGTLDPVMADKAAHGDKSAEDYRAYYDTGYATDVDRIEIDGATVRFFTGADSVSGTYESDGYEVLTYDSGNRGVRFIFEKTEGDDAAPGFIQFSDHRIAPSVSDHYHLYWGDDREALLSELTNWPTYYPATLSPEQIVSEMLAH